MDYQQQIEGVKATGAREALARSLHSTLWCARRDMENAEKDGFKNFNECIEKTKRQIEEATAMHDALKAMTT